MLEEKNSNLEKIVSVLLVQNDKYAKETNALWSEFKKAR